MVFENCIKSSLTSFKEHAGLNSNFSWVSEVIILNPNCYMCWGRVIILKPFEKHKSHILIEYGPQFSSVSQSCPTLCDPMNRSTPGLPVHHQLPEFIQTHVHRVSDAIQPSHPLSSPSPPAPNPSQHQNLFQWGGQSKGVSALVSFLPKNTQDWSPLG